MAAMVRKEDQMRAKLDDDMADEKAIISALANVLNAEEDDSTAKECVWEASAPWPRPATTSGWMAETSQVQRQYLWSL